MDARVIVGADAAFYDQYPKDADPDTSMPYVMWAGTPLQHLPAGVLINGPPGRSVGLK